MKKGSGYPAICGRCHQLLDLADIQRAIRAGRRMVHECGKVLVAGAAADIASQIRAKEMT